MHMSRRGAERDRETFQSRLLAVSAETYMGLRLTNYENMTQAEVSHSTD